MFDASSTPSFGVEEELMLLDASTLDLSPTAAQLLGSAGAPPGAKLELPASQVEFATTPAVTIDALAEQLRAGRERIAAAAAPRVRPAGAGLHPFAAPAGELNRSARYDRIRAEYGWVAERQLVCAMHVHVGLGGGAARALAVYNELRSHLPDLAALAANAPYREGRDTGMASVRPLVGGMLPRQGVPPALDSFEDYARQLRWAHAGGRIESVREWWWELRLHAALGTVELRAPDTQTTVTEAMAVAALAGTLALWLGERHEAGDLPRPAETWRIADNRWAAARHGLDAPMIDVHSGRRASARERVQSLLDELAATGVRVGASSWLTCARALSQRNGALRQREVGSAAGPRAVAQWLADAFLTEGMPAV
jgi:carboxylate-amine ligase